MRPTRSALRLLRRLLIGAFLLLASLQIAAAQGRRVALVVGNAAYRAEAQLANPGNDAKLMARTLARLGFQLIGGGARVNLNKAEFESAVREFGLALPGTEVALFYYSGHGMQVRGTNWLVPLDANPSRVQDLDFQMIDTSLVLKQMEGAGTKLNVMILDACRNNPFGGHGLRGTQPGLAQLLAPEGTVISYATQPGNTALDGNGGNSPYTLALAEAMTQPGLDVLRMFNRVGVTVKKATGGEQQPWVSSSPIDGDYFFAGAVAGPALVGRSSSGLPDRITAKATPVNIPVPSHLNFADPAPDVPPNIAKFVGAWGPGRWGAYGGGLMLVVERVDAAGNAHVYLLENSGCKDVACTDRAPMISPHDAKIEDGTLSYATRNNIWRHSFTIDATGSLQVRSVNHVNGKTGSATLRRLE